MTQTIPTRCYLTDLPIKPNSFHDTLVDQIYSIQFGDREIFVTVCDKCLRNMLKDPAFPKYRKILRSLIANDKLGNVGRLRFHWDTGEKGLDKNKMTNFSIKQEVDLMPYPRTSRDKLENFLKGLFEMQEYEGQELQIKDFINPSFWAKWYFDNHEEALFYLLALDKQGLVNLNSRVSYNTPALKVTYDGQLKYQQLFEEGYNSKYCFIAMAFDDRTKEARAAIKKALIATGFQPFIVDEEHLDSTRTIPDGIIAGLRQSKFCIADFTFHKNGVYFEAGFAVGQGKQVIYTCSKDEFDKAHFDIKQLQHIIYENTETLYEQLVSKIEAWIK